MTRFTHVADQLQSYGGCWLAGLLALALIVGLLGGTGPI